MSTTFAGLSRTIRIGLVCAMSVVACGAQAQRPAEAVPSQLLSDDERLDFCSQMRRAATPEDRKTVTARLRDTLAPRAKGQGVALPGWLLEGRPANDSANIPGLDCQAGQPGAARPRVQPAAPAVPAAPAKETSERKPPPAPPAARDAATARQPVKRDDIPPLPPSLASTAPVPAPPAAAVSAEEAPARSTATGDIPVGHDRGVAYVTGGVGQDEAAAFRGLAPGYNMRATFTTGSGEYLSGVAVQVLRADGSVAFSATSDGPYLYARLPQGRYRVVATLDGVPRSRELYVPARGGVKFSLVWPNIHAGAPN